MWGERGVFGGGGGGGGFFLGGCRGGGGGGGPRAHQTRFGSHSKPVRIFGQLAENKTPVVHHGVAAGAARL
jgi:hypothetical protein